MSDLADQVRLLRTEPMARLALRARLERPMRTRRFHEFGERSILHRPGWLYGAHKIAVGSGVIILNNAWLSAERPTWNEIGPAIRIGNGTVLRQFAVITASARITIEENVLVGGFCTFVDSDHQITESDHNPLWNPWRSAPIRVGAGSWLGERVTVLKGSDIGRKCIIGAHSVVRGTIPDHSVAVGIPARVIGSTLPVG